MKVGIVGLPESGKTTLFKALTRCQVKTDSFGSQSGKANIGVVSVPDSRIDYFAAQYSPKKITYAAIEFIDGAAKIVHDEGRTKFASDFFSDVRQVDALVHVVRGFPNISGDSPNPIKDVQVLSDELLLADLQLVETRMQRVEKQTHGVKKGVTTNATAEMDFLKRIQSALENGESLKTFEFTVDEEKAIKGYDFLTLKSMVVVFNINEAELSNPSELTSNFKKYCEEQGIPFRILCADLEMEVSQLADEEEVEFLKSMGIDEPARNILIRECYKTLGLISFITAGEPEVRAWTIKNGTKAVDAAGAIHSDLSRGFIRMEVANFVDVEAAGSWEDAKQKGIVALQGKEYIVQDGDVVYIRFKV